MLADGAVKIPTLDEAEHPGSDVEGPGQEKRQRQNDLEVYGFSDWNLEGEIAGSGLDGYNKDESIKASAVQWLREKGSGLNKTGRPFFLAVNFVNPHDIVYYNPNPGGQRTVMETNDMPDNTVYMHMGNLEGGGGFQSRCGLWYNQPVLLKMWVI